MSADGGVLRQVLEIIETQPARHYQAYWLDGAFDDGETLFGGLRPAAGLRQWGLRPMPAVPSEDDPKDAVCGTRGCVGGWICLLTAPLGALVSADMIFLPEGTRAADDLAERSGYETEHDGKPYIATDIEAWARDEAGLTDDQVDYLFDSERSRDAVLKALRYLIEVNPDASGDELYDECGS